MSQPDIRILQTGDEAALEAFLLPRVADSMFLIGNMRTAGLVDGGRPYEGTYAAAFERGQIVSVAAHYWNGNLIFQAPLHLEALARAAVAASGRPLQGLIGPQEQVGAAKAALGVADDAAQMDESEGLYRLALAGLIVPPVLGSGRARGRRIEPRDLDLVSRWRVQFCIESLGDEDSPQLYERCRASLERSLAQGWTWILEWDGQPVASSSFNTAIREAVQIGGVWTPPELRQRGYGRAVVAASLLDARAEGVGTSILFTGQDNIPAQKAYRALGFGLIGNYRLLLLRAPVAVPAAGA
jgi:RimJ/RimL family protein N-acetyltransferase